VDEKKSYISHETLNSVAALLGVALAVLSLALQLHDRTQESVERFIVQPAISSQGELEIGVINVGRRDTWIRYVSVNFYDEAGKLLDGRLSVKPPPDDAVQLLPKQVLAFRSSYQESKVPSGAVYGEISVGTSLGDVPSLYVSIDFFHPERTEAYGLFARRKDGMLWRLPAPAQILQEFQ